MVLDWSTGLMIIQSEANTRWLGTPTFDHDYKMMTWRYWDLNRNWRQTGGGRCVLLERWHKSKYQDMLTSIYCSRHQKNSQCQWDLEMRFILKCLDYTGGREHTFLQRMKIYWIFIQLIDLIGRLSLASPPHLPWRIIRSLRTRPNSQLFHQPISTSVRKCVLLNHPKQEIVSSIERLTLFIQGRFVNGRLSSAMDQFVYSASFHGTVWSCCSRSHWAVLFGKQNE